MGHGLDISTKESQSQTSAVLMLIQLQQKFPTTVSSRLSQAITSLLQYPAPRRPQAAQAAQVPIWRLHLQELARLGAQRHLDHHGALLRPGRNAAKLVPNWAPDGTLKSMEENLIEIRGRFANYIYIYINLLLLEN